jgi:hypothetical protein
MSKLNELATKLGIDESDLAKIESGELSIDDYATSYHKKYEETLKPRFKKEIEDAVMPDAYGRAWGKVEKMLSDEFGLSIDEFNDIPKNERTSKMLAKIKEVQKSELDKFKDMDAATKDAYAKLDLANELLQKSKSEKDAAVMEIKAEYSKKETKNAFENTITKKIASVENPALDAEFMESVVLGRIQKLGYKYEAENGTIWLTQNGVRVANPNRATENLTLATFFDIIAAEKNFTKASNGPAGGGRPNTDATPVKTTNMHPNFIKKHKELGNL